MSARRLLFVHAHPDDETISTGATMAHHAAQGDSVTLLTCTLGEEGEILVPALARLEAAQADQLGGWRISELTAAMRELGVTDHRFLGGAGRFRDSGMAGSPANDHPRALWRAAEDDATFDLAVELVADVIREVRPHVVVTYDEAGDYGHPDHVMAHRITTAALVRSAAEWPVPKVYWTATPRSVLAAGCARVAAADLPAFHAVPADELGFGVDDVLVTTAVAAPDSLAAKTAALRAHATQVAVDGAFFALTNMIGREIQDTEYYRLVTGEPGPDRDPDGFEAGLLQGIDT